MENVFLSCLFFSFPAQENVSNVKLLFVSEASLSDQSACCLEKSLKRVGRFKTKKKKVGPHRVVRSGTDLQQSIGESLSVSVGSRWDTVGCHPL